MTPIRRVIWVVLDSVGIGAMPDAADYGDPPGSDTLGNIARQRPLHLPNLAAMGLGNIKPLAGIAPAQNPSASYGKCALRSPGKDTTTGHWEMAGIILEKPFPLFPDVPPMSRLIPGFNVVGWFALCGQKAMAPELVDRLEAAVRRAMADPTLVRRMAEGGLSPRFEAVRRSVLAAQRDRAALVTEVRAMREKVRAAHPVKAGRFGLKHSAGGMIDVEFAVQTLVLAESGTHAELLDNVGNIALLGRAEAAGLLPAGVGSAAADAYRDLRRAQHRARLDERSTQLDPETMATQRAAVLALWRVVFG